MYTQCPDCSTAFRVTANDLRQAAGKVRCGGCGNAFDALEFLTEDMPEQPPEKESPRQLPELQPDRPARELPEKISPEESIALLKTLDELAGSDIRLEDTGIEWRVLDDQLIAELETTDTLDEETDAATDDADETDDEPQSDEPRYDDDTPLPEDAEEQDASEAIDEDVPEDETPAEELPGDEAQDRDVESQSDEVDDWEEILDEVDAPDEEEQADDASEEEPSVSVDEDTAVSGESGDVEEEVDDDEDPDRDEAAGHDDDADSDEDSGDDEDADHDEGAEHDEQVEHLPDVKEEEVEVESIIMEGETVRNALDELAGGAQAAEVDMSQWERPEEDLVPDRSDKRKSGMAFGVFLLLLVLGLQVVHYYRERLATAPAIQGIIAPVYRAIGMPLAPDWDVTGWRFEATQGSTDGNNDELTVNSRIGNTSDESLPYPLVGISLTDRFDNTVGSRLLEPHEYLTDGANPRKLVEAGATFDAIISIRSPDTLATGYKLNVCYRSSGGTSAGKLRCAIGDFKE